MPEQPTFATARSDAERLARSQVEHLLPVPGDVLSSFHMEAEGCWFFFLTDELRSQTDCPGSLRFSAYAIAKAGKLDSFVYDFRPDMNQMRDYVEVWSLYALGKKEDANAALQDFNNKYPAVLSDAGA